MFLRLSGFFLEFFVGLGEGVDSGLGFGGLFFVTCVHIGEFGGLQRVMVDAIGFRGGFF